MSSNRYVNGAGTLDMTEDLFQLRFQENCSFLSCTLRPRLARIGRSRASASMKFSRTITKVERRVCLIGALFICIAQSGMAAGQPATQYYRDSCPELVGDWDWTWDGGHAVVSFRNGREAISGGQEGRCITA